MLDTVIARSGATPRWAGACMLVNTEGRQCGTIGGGAVEHRGEQMARELLLDKSSRAEFFAAQNQVEDLA